MSNIICPPKIKHFSHDHLLELTTTDNVRLTSLCSACNKRPDTAVSGSIPASNYVFACCACDYFLHIPCSQLPKLNNHPRFPTNMPQNSRPAAPESKTNPQKVTSELGMILAGHGVQGVANAATTVVLNSLLSKLQNGVVSDGCGGDYAVITKAGDGYLASDNYDIFVSCTGDSDGCGVITDGSRTYGVIDGGGDDYGVSDAGLAEDVIDIISNLIL